MNGASRIAVAIVTALLSLCPAAPAGAEDRWRAIEALLSEHYPAGGPGAYAIAAEGERILFSKGFGQANLEYHIPLAANGVLRIASLTKQFTATAILLLVQSGALRLEDRLALRLPDCPAQWRDITIRQLLNHTSGITADLKPLFAHRMDDLTPQQLLALYADRPLESAPGDKWQYSNVNYWILGRIVEHLIGQNYADFVAQRVLLRGMVRTRYGSASAIVPDRVAGYERADGGWQNAGYFSQTLGYAAGGFISTPTEMARWYGALSRGEVLSPGLLALALTEARTRAGKETGYGLGWYVSTIGGVRVAHHGGGTIGFQCYVYWVPSRALFVGVFKNVSDDRGEPMGEARAMLDVAMAERRR